MKNKLTLLQKGFPILLLLFSFALYSQSTAVYDISFTSTWNSIDHGTLPGNPHWSDLVGTTHKNAFSMWNIDKKASLGIKNVAELGDGAELLNEVNIAISNGNADIFRQANFAPNNALGVATLTNIQVDEAFPLVSLVSMIAPSPDWFIGISNLSLLDGPNSWKATFSMDVFPLDAGTDSGSNYEAADLITTPVDNITSLVNVSPFGSERIGYFTFTFKGVLGIEDFEKESPKIYPNPTNNLLTINNLNNFKKIEMYDVTGKQVFNESLNNVVSYSFNTNSYTNGLYFIKLKTKSDKQIIKKVLIQ